MALLWCDGFRYGGIGKYDASGGTVGITTTAGRDNGLDAYGLVVTSNFQGFVDKTLAGAPATVIIGFAVFLDPVRTANYQILRLFDGVNNHLQVELNFTTFVVTVKRGDGTVLGTSTPVATATGEWVYLELKATISDTTGAVEVRKYGVSVLTLANVDTRNGGAAQITTVRLGQMSFNTQSLIFDDYYICDTSGATNNDFLADTTNNIRVIDCEPNAAGDSTQWVATGAGGVNWDAAADETAPDNDTSYVASSTVGDRDLYNMTGTPAGLANIRGAVAWAVARKDDATARSLGIGVKSGGVTQDSAAFGLTNVYAPYATVLETDPATGAAWTKAAVDAVQVGPRVAA